MARTVREAQQDFSRMSGFGSSIFWDLYAANQSERLKEKIVHVIAKDEDESKESKRRILRSIIFQSIWAQRKYTNGNCLCAPIFVMVAETEKTENVNDALNSQKYSVHTIFRAKKCFSNNNETNCCILFIDEIGRVYQNWEAFLNENLFEAGIMVAPKNGIYNFDESGNVLLQCRATPASSLSQKMTGYGDYISAGMGFLSLGVTGAAILASAPISAPILTAATVAGYSSVGWGGARAFGNLRDRSAHEQSISLADREALGAWLGVAAGAVCLGGSVATKALASAVATTGKASLAIRFAANGMSICSIALSAGGLYHGIMDIYLKFRDDETLTKVQCSLMVANLASSLFLFTHSVYNFQWSSAIIENMQTKVVGEHRANLSNRQRRMFDKMFKETLRINGNDVGMTNVIRSINEIPDSTYLNNLRKVNSALNKQKVRPSFGGAERPVVLNNELPVDTQTLRNNLQHNIGANPLDQLTQPIPRTQKAQQRSAVNQRMQQITAINAGTEQPYRANYVSGVPTNVTPEQRSLLEIVLYSGAIMRISELGLALLSHKKNDNKFQEAAQALATELVDSAFEYIVKYANDTLENLLTEVESMLKQTISSERVLRALFLIIRKCSYQTLSQIQNNIRKIAAILKGQLMAMDEAEEIQNFERQYSAATTRRYTPSQSLDELLEVTVTLAGDAVFPLSELADIMLQRILEFHSFENVINDMAEKYPDEAAFRRMLGVATKFLEAEAANLESQIQMPIRTEWLLHRMLLYSEQNMPANSIIDHLKTYFLSLRTINEIAERQRCETCAGYFSICEL